MTVQVFLPQLGFSMEQGKLLEWLVQDGTAVVEGAPICTLEADKSVQEIEAPASGRLRIIASADETYAVGTLLGEID